MELYRRAPITKNYVSVVRDISKVGSWVAQTIGARGRLGATAQKNRHAFCPPPRTPASLLSEALPGAERRGRAR